MFMQVLLTSQWCLFQALHCVRTVLADYCSTISHVVIIEPENKLDIQPEKYGGLVFVKRVLEIN